MPKRLLILAMLLVCASVLCSCVSTGLPIEENAPDVTLPPAEVSFVAPIGDAALEYTQEATLYLPSQDGISLTTVQTDVTYSPVRPKADSLVRALLAQAATRDATALGGNVRLSLYGTSPVEVSRDVVTVNLSASALQLDREALHLACQAIANTLTQLDGIQYVNVLVVDKPAGVDVANTLPMGAYRFNDTEDLGAVYKQLLSRRVTSTESTENKPFSANVTLYFPLQESQCMVSEVRPMSFENQNLSDMVIAILRELGNGPHSEDILSPDLPLLADLLTATPALIPSGEAGGSLLKLDFAHNLYDMLDAYGISRAQCSASLCYTFSTFLPNVSGVSLTVGGAPVDPLLMTESDEAASDVQLRSSFSDQLYDYATLYFIDPETQRLRASVRPAPYYQASNPRWLLQQLARGPQPQDSQPQLEPVMIEDGITDVSILGCALSDTTLLVNFSPHFSRLATGLDGARERLLAYALVNTLCMDNHIKSVCFFQSGSQFEGFSGDIYWAGLFYPMPM